MTKINGSKVLSIFFVIAFLLAAPSGVLVALAKGSHAKIHSARISNSVSIRAMDKKDTKSEVHERKDLKVSEAASAHEKEIPGKVKTTTSFDDHKSNSNGDSSRDAFTHVSNSGSGGK